jgi:hypothetical protein
MVAKAERRQPARTVAVGIGLLGAVAWGIGVYLDAPRALAAWLVALIAGLTIPLGALALLLLGMIIRTETLLSIRPLLAAIARTLPVFAALFLPVAFGMWTLYPWAAAAGPADAGPADAGPAGGAGFWLQPWFFLARAASYFGLWSGIALLAARTPADAPRQALGGAGLILLVFTSTLAAIDWVMSLEPDWGSTAFGLYLLGGALTATLATLALADGFATRSLTADQRQTLGNLLLTAVLFWAWIAFTQYYIIWIANLPFEVTWYIDRTHDGWALLAAALVLLHFVVPVAALLLRPVKRSALALSAISAWLLAAHYADVYWLIMPSLPAARPHVLDLGALAAIGGLAVFAATRPGRPAMIPGPSPSSTVG